MRHPRYALAVSLLALLVSFHSHAQAPKEYQPQIGQQGKDVIWVPTPDEIVERMLTMAQVKPTDYVVDLGAGDGKIAIMAAKKFGAKSLGIEYNPDMARHAQSNAVKAGVTDKAQIQQGDIFATDFTSATVVTMYLLPTLNLKLRPTLLAMRPGTRVVSHSFTMEDWQPDETSTFDGRRAYFWVVPAQVQGAWIVKAGNESFELTLEQRFQKLDGSMRMNAMQAGLRDATLHGASIAFSFVDEKGVMRQFSGRVNGAAMEGTLRTEGRSEEVRWNASKR